MSRRLALLVLLGMLAVPAAAQAQSSRTWVSGVGDDANPCSRTAPCKTFAGTITKTAPGGIIDSLDPGSFGVVTITQTVTLDGTGQPALQFAAAGPAITINAAGKDIRLRHLTLNYANHGACSATGTANGIRILDARSVSVDDVSVRGFPGAGISVEPSAAGTHVVVRDSRLQGNCTAGLQARRTGGGVTVDVFDSVVADNPVGILAGTDSIVRLAGTTVTHNTAGLMTETSASLVSFGDNRVAGNGTDGTPTAYLHQPPAAPSDSPGATSSGGGTTPGGGGTTSGGGQSSGSGETPPTPVCVVPKLAGLTFRGTVDALFAADCRLGEVTYRLRKSGKRLRTYAQDIRAGVVAQAGTPVGITFNAKPSKHRVIAHAAAGVRDDAWVYVLGDDANPCSRTAPCRTLAAAQASLNQGGVIAVLSPGDYGPLTVDRPLTIDGGDRQTAVLGGGIVVDAVSGDVTLRNLLVQSDVPCSAAGSADGIKLLSATSLRLENVTVRGFSGDGVHAVGARVLVDGGAMSQNCSAGIAATGADVTAVGARIAGNATGVAAGNGATVRTGANRITDNAAAYAATGTGNLRSWGDVLEGNGSTGAAPAFLGLW